MFIIYMCGSIRLWGMLGKLMDGVADCFDDGDADADSYRGRIVEL